jgi:hypothetical protein
MIGRHLVPPPHGIGDHLLRIGILPRDHQAARPGQRRIRTVRIAHLLDGPAHERVDIAMVVGEQHVALEMLWVGAAVMTEARQAEIDAQRIEQGQRLRVSGQFPPFAIGDLVPDMGKIGGRKVPRQIGRRDVGKGDAVADHIGERDFLGGAADLDIDVIIAEQEVDLLRQVIGKQLRPGDALRVETGRGQPSIGAASQGLGRIAMVADA